MALEIPIDKKNLIALGKALPTGAFAEIEKRLNAKERIFSTPYISRYFRGGYNITDQNRIIIEIAKQVLTEQLAKASIIANDIQQSADMAKKIKQSNA